MKKDTAKESHINIMRELLIRHSLRSRLQNPILLDFFERDIGIRPVDGGFQRILKVKMRKPLEGEFETTSFMTREEAKNYDFQEIQKKEAINKMVDTIYNKIFISKDYK